MSHGRWESTAKTSPKDIFVVKSNILKGNTAQQRNDHIHSVQHEILSQKGQSGRIHGAGAGVDEAVSEPANNYRFVL
ncbi:3305_t:CDS:2 [Paraglomus occultum]|uniref:3305_t:CDS:1 n=1 Tax=Paraglomus occultum TaxID=144539 RepID=A0A9N9FF79_9GLOM|nr:3305_t:CDS:2 [Paraglomus occultum]